MNLHNKAVEVIGRFSNGGDGYEESKAASEITSEVMRLAEEVGACKDDCNDIVCRLVREILGTARCDRYGAPNE